ncbi:TRAP transporter substrate-binding protein DctP [Alisedimentitalea sp. MJ-SS2]|uniref:TRAP transporter substrate-binding protein n=1 Tax=Aliisedimentitalea sp. MJ-SS2 TaxID=3049795 RepID=UPI00290C7C56|nr:TRAP transporter substrate-binding protein DctP [Alisedimentitalea sp. MJ-SS2]MDU8929121.1 TRAP transporter substrate-binding protein DctP [Alisedimentitalea sp. MJ-SS2]
MKHFTKLAGVALSAALTFGSAADAKELRLGTITPDNTIWAKQAIGFVAKVEELSGGDLTISYFGNAELGTMADTMKMTLTGRLDMWLGAIPALGAVVPEMSLLSLPYVFDSPTQAGCAVPKLMDRTRVAIGKKFHLLGFTAVGTQSIGAKKEIRTPSDLANIKLRTAPLKTTMTFFGTVGANPVPLAAAESTAALGTGLVDAVDFAPTFYVATGVNKTATFFAPTRHTYNLGGLAISSKTWAGLSDAEKQILSDAWAQAMPLAQNVAAVEGFEAKMLGAHKKSGGTVVELTEEEQAAWKEAGLASWEKILPELRGDVDGYLAAIQAAKQGCGS